MSKITDALPLPPIYYHPTGACYWIEDAAAKWIKINETSAKLWIKTHGFSDQKTDGVSQAEKCLLDIQARQNVVYSGPLAGYQAGHYQINNNSVLVTETPRLVVPAPGEWPTIRAVLEGLFGLDNHRQLDHLYGWLKLGIEAVYSGTGSPGQALVMAGPVNSGKSLTQNLITAIFGGRSAKPYLFMTGGTPFNADLFRAEHLMIEDDAEHITTEKRRHFAAHIKSICVNRDQHCHGKNKEALTLTPIWRISISLNDEPQRILVLPNLDEDVADKMIILKAQACSMPMPTDTPAERKAFWERLVKELPHFVHFLQHWEIPADLQSSRFGITHFHHPDIAALLFKASPENRLMEMIDQSLFSGCRLAPGGASIQEPIEKTARELQESLERGCAGDDARHLLRYGNSCGTYLGKLARSPQARHRISSRTVQGDTVWTILPPTNPMA